MRFINKQQHTTSCGPVAAINAVKWAGGKLAYREILGLFKTLCWNSSAGRGQYPKYMSSNLNLFGLKYKKMSYPKISDIEAALDKGNGVILCYKWYQDNKTSGHYVFIDKHTPKYFNAYNSTLDGNPKESKNELRKWMRSSKIHNTMHPQMWEIVRDE